MSRSTKLPDEFLHHLGALEVAYLETDDPLLQSGYSGGPDRWRAERTPILDAVTTDGDLLDVGCANGHLLECLRGWAGERGVTLTPFGVDISARLIDVARRRLPSFEKNFYVANAWDWVPPRQYRYVYALSDCVPTPFLVAYVERLLARAVAPGGRLIVGAYGSRSRGVMPLDVRSVLTTHGFCVSGSAQGGDLPVSVFAWIDA